MRATGRRAMIKSVNRIQVATILAGAFIAIGAAPTGLSAQAQGLNLNFLDWARFGAQIRPSEIVTPATAPATNFDAFKQEIWREASAQGVSRQTFDRAFAGVSPDAVVLEKANRQPEFVTPIWDYLANAVSERRVNNGSAKMQELRGILDAVEAKYGVSRAVVVAIWGIESSYGSILQNRNIVRPVIQSLATLAYRGGKRAKYGRTQLVAALVILERGDTTPQGMLGSWAGAMGHTQFIPTTYKAYAVDFDGDGRRDIWNSVADALASTAHYLRVSGWRTGETWGYEVVLPGGFDFGQVGQKLSVAQWSALGVRRTHDRLFPRPGDEAELLLPAGARGPAFLMLKNFSVIKRYNNSDSYALAVGHLSDRLIGGGPLASRWPVEERPLGRREREELQRLLVSLGFDPGSVDGKIGPKTRRAVRAFQQSVGLTPDGFPTARLLEQLRRRS